MYIGNLRYRLALIFRPQFIHRESAVREKELNVGPGRIDTANENPLNWNVYSNTMGVGTYECVEMYGVPT